MAMSPRDQLLILQLRYFDAYVSHHQFLMFSAQLVFALNSSWDWRQEHAGFHYPSFYNFIVDLLEDEDSPL